MHEGQIPRRFRTIGCKYSLISGPKMVELLFAGLAEP